MKQRTFLHQVPMYADTARRLREKRMGSASTSYSRIDADPICAGEALRQRQREQWLAENREAMGAYNTSVEQHGVFSDGLRSF